jgi:hypothetical protein
MKKIPALAVASSIVIFAAACSSTGEANRSTANTNAPANSMTTNTATSSSAPAANTHSAVADGSDVPAAVRAALADAQTFTTQHKDIPASAITSIEKETETKVADKDHHSYLAFSTAGGARRQIGAATVVNAGGQEMVIVYDSKDGSPVIREVRGAGVPAAFLDQFKGKGHDDALKFGQDIKAQDAPAALAQTATAAIKADVLAMQALYGAAHSH